MLTYVSLGETRCRMPFAITATRCCHLIVRSLQLARVVSFFFLGFKMCCTDACAKKMQYSETGILLFVMHTGIIQVSLYMHINTLNVIKAGIRLITGTVKST